MLKYQFTESVGCVVKKVWLLVIHLVFTESKSESCPLLVNHTYARICLDGLGSCPNRNSLFAQVWILGGHFATGQLQIIIWFNCLLITVDLLQRDWRAKTIAALVTFLEVLAVFPCCLCFLSLMEVSCGRLWNLKLAVLIFYCLGTTQIIVLIHLIRFLYGCFLIRLAMSHGYELLEYSGSVHMLISHRGQFLHRTAVWHRTSIELACWHIDVRSREVDVLITLEVVTLQRSPEIMLANILNASRWSQIFRRAHQTLKLELLRPRH